MRVHLCNLGLACTQIGSDALVLLVMKWLVAFNAGESTIIYCSDVSGAFDRVNASRLILKLTATGLHAQLVKLMKSWLSERRAQVIVGGKFSREFILKNIVFQGTVIGPDLRNVFYANSKSGFRGNCVR